MKLTPICQSDWPIIREWLSDPKRYQDVMQANSTVDTTKPFETYILRLSDNSPAGWLSLFNVEPKNQAEFGIVIVDKRTKSITGKAAFIFLDMMFKKYQLKQIYVVTNEESEIPARKFGFVNHILTRQDFERKWSKWLGH